MGLSIPYSLQRLASEPPFRIAVRALLSLLKTSASTRATWDLSARPAYLTGLVAAAEQARRQNVTSFSAIEFGVAAGAGLLVLQSEASAIEQETGIEIKVFGFDMGASGLPDFIGDYRDHPDVWQPGDYPMDEARLRARLEPRTQLVLGNLKETVPNFVERYAPPPIGFVSVDVDLYSSARDALKLLGGANTPLLWHVPLYLDDIDFFFNHRFAGELLAVEEFNATYANVKIDRWYGVRNGRPFADRPYLDKMYVAHDLLGASSATVNRSRGELALTP